MTPGQKAVDPPAGQTSTVLPRTQAKGGLPSCSIARARFHEKNPKCRGSWAADDFVLHGRAAAQFAKCDKEHEFPARTLLGRSHASGLQVRPPGRRVQGPLPEAHLSECGDQASSENCAVLPRPPPQSRRKRYAD